MGIFDILRGPDINAKVSEANEKGAVIVDVRSDLEYRSGHIPGAICVPLEQLDRAVNNYRGKDVELYVYCASGSRSSQAVRYLQSQNLVAQNIGGIVSWKGDVER